MLLNIWRTAVKLAATQAAATLLDNLHDRFATRAKNAGIIQLKMIMLRRMKGEAAMRITIWVDNCKADATKRKQNRLRKDILIEKKGVALRQLRFCLVRLMRGVLS